MRVLSLPDAKTLRLYGLEGLARRRKPAWANDAHCRYFRELTADAMPGLRSADLPQWLERLAAEHANLRVAIEWSERQGDDEGAAAIASAIYPFWDLHGHYREGRACLRRVTHADRAVSPMVRARALIGERHTGLHPG